MEIVFIGNFVNDVIVKRVAGGEEKTTLATGGSVTYGSLATSMLGCSPRVITRIGDDLPISFLDRLDQQHIIHSKPKPHCKNGSYRLFYDETNQRTLTLAEKGLLIEKEEVLESLGKPDAICFVPVAAEFDEGLVLEVVKSLKEKEKDENYHPIVSLDVQGFIRTFNEGRVLTRSPEEMRQKFHRLSSISHLGVVTIFKAEYGEAAAMVGPLEPKECAKRLREDYGFTVASVTMGPLGGYLSSDLTGEIYVPTFKPRAVLDETGCGDTFLASTVVEILHMRKQNGNRRDAKNLLGINEQQLFHSFLVGSAAASYLVESVGPEGFETREKILERVNSGERTLESSAQVKFSLTLYDSEK